MKYKIVQSSFILRVYYVGVINEDKVIQCVTTEMTVEDMTVIVATNNIYQGVAAS